MPSKTCHSAFRLLQQTLRRGFIPHRHSLGGVFRERSDLRDLLSGRQLHAVITKSGLHLQSSVVAGLVDLYSKCGSLAEAVRLFDSLPSPVRDGNCFLWNVMLNGYSRYGDFLEAFLLYREMLSAGVSPNQFTFPSVLSGSSGSPKFGIQVHGHVLRSGFHGCVFVQSSLVDMYVKCGDLSAAKKILEEESEERDVVAWNSLMGGFARRGLASQALFLFDEMRHRGIEPDEFTFTSLLNSVAVSGLVAEGKVLHCCIMKSGFAEGFAYVSNAMLDMYAKCGNIDDAVEVFESLPHKDVVSWTSLITGCAGHGFHEAALELFSRMRCGGVVTDHVVAAGALSCAAALPALPLGEQLHSVILRCGLREFVSVSNALVSMYAKSGSVEESRKVFNEMEKRDSVTWTAMIVGCAQNGRSRESLSLYQSMVENGEKPDYVTFIGVLIACSHAGMEQEAREIFASMEKLYGVVPGREHFACMVHILCRMKNFTAAAELLAHHEFTPDAATWKMVLAACRNHGGGEAAAMADRAAAALLLVDPLDADVYTLLANVHATGKRWEDMGRARRMMKSHGVRKEPGWSWMEIRSEVHAFRASELSHPRTKEIYTKVEEMMGRISEAGLYRPDLSWALHDKAEEGELAHHSEKLAVAFGLLSVPSPMPIRIFKNLRICGDCHAALKAVAKVYRRRIVVRDANYFHHFGIEGNCSCGDFW